MTDKGHPPPIGISRTIEQAYSHTGDNPYTGVGLGMAIIGSQAIQVCRTLSASQYRYAILYYKWTARKYYGHTCIGTTKKALRMRLRAMILL